MRSNKLLPLLLFFLTMHTAFPQKAKREPLKHEKEVRDMIAFFQYMLNTLGDAGTANRDKDVMVMESYTKIFRDAKVQVEDDLDPDRKVITNKDVTAYLKDVDFFFKDVKFEFNIDAIEAAGTSGDKLYYKVSLSRNLNGTTADGKPIRNTMKRFIEINYDTKAQDLKIVSIYTNQFNEKQAMLDWWNSLSYEWKSIFTQKFSLGDSVQLNDIRKVTGMDSLDISGNRYIRNIDPVSELHDLRYLNISHTAISDVTPLRNLTELADVDISKTAIRDLSPLRYAVNLSRLNMSNTSVDSIQIIQRFPNLKVLEMKGSTSRDFSILNGLDSLVVLDLERTNLPNLQHVGSLTNLRTLNVSKTSVTDISVLKNLSKLALLNIDSTRVKDISALSNLKGLRVLHMNHTQVNSLSPLKAIGSLERIYCDHTGVTQDEANNFTTSNPNTLVIYDSEDLRGWWTDLPSVWKDVFSRRAKIGYSPGKEDLAKVANLDSINISNYVNIKSLAPLSRLQKLRVLIATKTGVTDIIPLKFTPLLTAIDISHTAVADLSPLVNLQNLKTLSADGTSVTRIDTLNQMKNLERLYVDNTEVNDSAASKFLEINPRCLVVYKTEHLQNWWSSLSPEWQAAFQTMLKIETQPTRNNFHKLIETEKLSFQNVRINDLAPLTEFIRVKELEIVGTDVTDLAALSEMRSLRTLIVRDHAIRGLGAIRNLSQLKTLDISNTAITELDVISELKKLKSLSCAGTPIKKLNPLQSLNQLELLDCSNTDIKNLEPIFHLPLKTLKCYNSKISKGDIDKFKKFNPDCNVIYYR
jgi:Leucine-rich repeat (LRR) protein